MRTQKRNKNTSNSDIIKVSKKIQKESLVYKNKTRKALKKLTTTEKNKVKRLLNNSKQSNRTKSGSKTKGKNKK